MKKQIISNLTSNYALSFFGLALGFFLVPFLIGKLGKAVYGIIVLTESTIAFFEIFTVSVRMALSRHATIALSQNKMDEFIGYLSTGFRVLYFSAALVLISGVLLSLNFPNIFKVPEGYILESKVHFLLIATAFTISIPNIIYWSMLYAKQRFDLINFSTSSGFLMRAIGIFAYYSLTPKKYATLVPYGFIFLVMTFTQNSLIYYWVKKIMPGIKISMKRFDRTKVREILSFSTHTSLTRGSQLLYENTANIIINVFWGPSYNAIYSIALKLPAIVKRIFVEPTWTLTPTFTDLVAKNDSRKIETIVYMFSKILSIATYPILLTLIIFSRSIITLWVGPDFIMAADLLRFYTVPLFVGIPFAFSGGILNAYAKLKAPSFVSFGTAIFNVGGCLVFGYIFSWKLYGIAFSSLLCTVVLITFYSWYFCRIAQFSLKRYWLESIIKPLALLTAIAALDFLIFKMMHLSLELNLTVSAAFVLSASVYYVLAYCLLLRPDEKRHIGDSRQAMKECFNFQRIRLAEASGY